MEHSYACVKMVGMGGGGGGGGGFPGLYGAKFELKITIIIVHNELSGVVVVSI